MAIDLNSLKERLTLSVEVLKLSARPSRRLRGMGIATLGDLVKVSSEDLLRCRGFGSRSLREVESKLSRIGLALGFGIAAPGYAKQYLDHPDGSPRVEAGPGEAVSLLTVGDLNLPPRANRCLKEMGISAVGDLLQCTPARLLSHPTFGQRSLREINAALRRLGVALAAEEPKVPTTIDIDRIPELALIRLIQPVEQLSLSRRNLDCLRRLDVAYVAELIQLEPDLLLKQRNFGRTSLAELQARLAPLGLTLGTRVVGWSRTRVDRSASASSATQGSDAGAQGSEGCTTTVSEELGTLAGAAGSRSNSSIARTYFGWDGGPRLTLEEVASRHGLSRERIRQICHKVEVTWANTRPYIPAIERCLAYIDTALPAPKALIERLLVSEKIIDRPLDLRGLLSAAKIARLKEHILILENDEQQLVARSSDVDWLSALLSTAKRVGVSTVEDLRFRVPNKDGSPADRGTILRVLSAINSLEWLDQISGWFWVRSCPRNRLVNQIRKVVTFVKRIQVGELRRALRRHHRLQDLNIPRAVLAALCERLPWCKLDGEWVIAVQDSDAIPRMTDSSETRIAEYLKSRGEMVRRDELNEYCEKAGIGDSIFNMQLANSPLIKRVAPEVYALVGTAVPEGSAFAAYEQSSAHGLTIGQGNGRSGEHWVCYYVSANMVRTGKFSVPEACRRDEPYELPLRDVRGSRFFTVRISRAAGQGLRPFLAAKGAEEGDLLALLFPSSRESVTAILGDAELVHACESGAVFRGEVNEPARAEAAEKRGAPDWLDDFLTG